jgi:hypothetical protein
MDNDILISQARDLYAVLHVKQYALSINNKASFDRLDRLVMWAYCRYQRRLNRCVLCYQFRISDCNREFGDNHSTCICHNPICRAANTNQDPTQPYVCC